MLSCDIYIYIDANIHVYTCKIAYFDVAPIEKRHVIGRDELSRRRGFHLKRRRGCKTDVFQREPLHRTQNTRKKRERKLSSYTFNAILCGAML